MKIPESPPVYEKIFTPKNLTEAFSFVDDTDINQLIRKANKAYMGWEKLKHQEMPKGVKPVVAWLRLKLVRKSQTKQLPAKDIMNKFFNYWLPDQVLEDLHVIDSFAGGQISLDEPIINKGSQTKYLIQSLMDEAISSSMLEGAATTERKGREMLISGRKPVSHADKMIYNNYVTIKKLDSYKDEPLSVELLNKIHETITEGTLKDPDTSGRFRNISDEMIVVRDIHGNILFEPPEAKEVAVRMNVLIQFANEADKPGEFIHPVVKAIILHFWLAYVHPFADGNGRTARALFYWYMLKRRYWMMEYISISQIILNAPVQYARAYLHTETDDQDLTYFIVYNLKVIRKAIERLKKFLADKQEKNKKYSYIVQRHPELNPRQKNLLIHAFQHPGHQYSIQNHKNLHQVTYQTARTDLLELADKGFLDKIKSGRTFNFLLSESKEKILLE
jgi:Fic family protein